MPDSKVFLTGFGAFEAFDANPSGALARRLAAAPPPGISVRCRVLPVSFARALPELDRELDRAFRGEHPALLLGLGVHRGHDLRLELRARDGFESASRPDVDGERAGGAQARRPARGRGPDLWTGLERELRAFVATRRGWCLSASAGGYVCEHVYRRLLEHGARLGRPALFVHVPPAERTDLDAQQRALGELLAVLLGG